MPLLFNELDTSFREYTKEDPEDGRDFGAPARVARDRAADQRGGSALDALEFALSAETVLPLAAFFYSIKA